MHTKRISVFSETSGKMIFRHTIQRLVLRIAPGSLCCATLSERAGYTRPIRAWPFTIVQNILRMRRKGRIIRRGQWGDAAPCPTIFGVFGQGALLVSGRWDNNRALIWIFADMESA